MSLLFIDTNVFVFTVHFPASNSAAIIQKIIRGELEAFVSERVVYEVEIVLKRTVDNDAAREMLQIIYHYCKIVFNDEIAGTINLWRGKIKEKDLENLAVVKHLSIPYLVSYDRDYEKFPEYRTPKQFVEMLKLKSYETEY